MLVLSRRVSERIRVGDSIVVTVLRVAGDKVRLGIKAPPDVLVLRDELEPHKSADSPPKGKSASSPPPPENVPAVEPVEGAGSDA